MTAPWQRWYQAWLARRVPPAKAVTLDQRRIFIFPNRQGLAFLILALMLFVGGINYQNNLVLGFSFLLFALFCVAIWHTFRNLAGLHIRVVDMHPACAGHQGHITLHLLAGRPHLSLRLWWLPAAQVEVSLAAGEELRVEVPVKLQKRGWNRPGRLQVESVFPLGLIRTWSLPDMDSACLAWPAPLPGGECPASGDQDKQGQKEQGAGNDDFAGLKEYVAGDNLHRIDWKTYARGHGLHVRHFTDPAEGKRLLEWERLPGMAVEERLSRLCYWARELERAGEPWGIVLPDAGVAPALGAAHLREVLDLLGRFGEVAP